MGQIQYVPGKGTGFLDVERSRVCGQAEAVLVVSWCTMYSACIPSAQSCSSMRVGLIVGVIRLDVNSSRIFQFLGGQQLGESCDHKRRIKATSPTTRYRTTIYATSIEMSLPYHVSGLSRRSKRPSAESREGLGGSDPGNLDGPPPAPAHRVHLQGKEFV